MKKLNFVLMFCIAIVSCKSDKKENRIIEEKENKIENQVVEQPKENNLQVSFNVIISSDMELLLRYTQNETLKYSPNNFVKVNVIGSNEPQDIIFALPANVFPTDMRMNFRGGIKDSISLYNVSFKMGQRTFEVPKEKIWNFFNPNMLTDFNQEKNTFFVKDEKENALPGFNFRPVLTETLEGKVY